MAFVVFTVDLQPSLKVGVKVVAPESFEDIKDATPELFFWNDGLVTWHNYRDDEWPNCASE